MDIRQDRPIIMAIPIVLGAGLTPAMPMFVQGLLEVEAGFSPDHPYGCWSTAQSGTSCNPRGESA